MYNYLIVDGNNFAWRAGMVMRLSTQEGKPISVVYGMLNMIRSLLDDYQPKMVCVCWDFKGSDAKSALFPEYKENRKKIRSAGDAMPDFVYKEVLTQIAELQVILPYFGIRQIKREGVEADDLIGLLCPALVGALVVSGDRDMFQVVDMGASLFYTSKDTIITRENFKEFSKVSPELYVYYRSVLGDLGDGIPGLRGFGEVTVSRLFEKYGDWRNWFIEGRVKVGILETLNRGQRAVIQAPDTKGILARNFALMNIGALVQDKKYDVLKDLQSQRPVFNEEAIRTYFLDNQFNSFIARYHNWIHSFRNMAIKSEKLGGDA
jgi:DNA polymerase I